MNEPLFALGDPLLAGLRDRVLLLRSVETFQRVDDDGLALLAERAKLRRFRAGARVQAEAEPARAVHVVLQGEVRVTRGGRSVLVRSREQELGLMAALTGAPGALSVAEVETRTLEIPAAALQVAVDQNFSLLRGLLQHTGARLLRARGSLPAAPHSAPEVRLGTYYERPRTLVERVLELRKSPFASMNVEALTEFARAMVEQRPAAGELLWAVGEPATHSFHVEYGCVRCTTSDGKHVDVGSDFTLGVMDVWGRSQRTYEARCVTPVIGYRVGFEDFLALLESHARVGADLLETFARGVLGTGELT
ncbi:MAG TPA: cyclic nucleotide-binding domain-containing protein [Polyangiaceae bacterium]|nr:cyclic nucleotide-binding domain-containing protein [Polyangiaceae bacterium]